MNVIFVSAARAFRVATQGTCVLLVATNENVLFVNRDERENVCMFARARFVYSRDERVFQLRQKKNAFVCRDQRNVCFLRAPRARIV